MPLSERDSGERRRHWLWRVPWFLLGGLLLLFICLQDTPQIERVTIGSPGSPSDTPLTIVQLSDLHMQGRRDVLRLKYALELVEREHPDAVVLTGDFVREDATQVNLATPLLTGLSAPLGSYAVLGNHDLWTDRHVVTEGLRSAGIKVLDNEGVVLSNGEAALYLAGLDDAWSGTSDLAAATEGNTTGLPVVMLIHEPDLGEPFVRAGSVWLQLSGHSHGGQVRVPGRGALILPDYAQQYDQGLYSVDDGWLYVNRGLGTTTVPIRLGCRPEVTVLTLYPPVATSMLP